MKKLLILLLFPLMMFSQDSTLIGDVDCSGEVNSQDASLILQFVTNVIDELPCEANMTGLTPDQLQEMIDMMEDQLSINYTGGSGGGCNYFFPDGLVGEPVYLDLLSSSYTVPNGKNLYIFSGSRLGGSTTYLKVNDMIHSELTSSSFGIQTETNPLIIKSGDVLSGDDLGSLATHINVFGILTEKIIEPVCLDLLSSSYTVPNGKILYVLSGSRLGGSTTYLKVNDMIHSELTTGGFYYQTGNTPLIIKSGDVLSGDDLGSLATHINAFGYLADEDYFADCSGGGGSTTNSLAETGSVSVTWEFPDGLEGEPIGWDFNANGDYIVPSGKNLYITNVFTTDGYAFRINGMKIIDEQWSTNVDYAGNEGMLKLPLCAKAGDVVSNSNQNADNTFYGILMDALVEPITFEFDEPGSGFENYTVTNDKKLYVTNIWAYGGEETNLTIDGVVIGTEPFNKASDHQSNSLEIPLIVNSNSVISMPDNFASFNGYLADVDYFSSAGSGTSTSSGINYMPGGFLQNPYDGDFLLVEQDIQPGNTFVYVVPSGKNLIIDGVSGYWALIMSYLYYNDSPYFDPTTNQDLPLDNIPFMEGDSLVFENTGNISQNIIFYGYLIDVDSSIEIVHIDLSSGQTYTVPAGKKLITSDVWSDNCLSINLTFPNGNTSITSLTLPENVKFLSPGTSISVNYNTATSPNWYYLFGTLIND